MNSPKNNIESTTSLLYIGLTGLVVMISLVLMMTVRMFFDVQNVQASIIQTNHTVYDVYRGEELLGSVNDIDAFKATLIDNFSSQIGVGNELLFGEEMEVVERFSEVPEDVQSQPEVMQHIINEGVYEVVAIHVEIVEDQRSYVVPSIKFWEDGLRSVTAAADSRFEVRDGASAPLDLEGSVEVNKVRVPVQEVLTKQEFKEQIMNPESHKFAVEESKTIAEVAAETNNSLTEILTLNPAFSEHTVLLPGTQVSVAQSDYELSFSRIQIVERLEPILYEIEYIEDAESFVGEEEVLQQGVEGLQNVQISFKYTSAGEELLLNQTTLERIEEPITHIVRVGTKRANDRGTGEFIWPSPSRRVSAEYMDPTYGGLHYGIDINDGLNRPIFASDNGVVVTQAYNSGYGNYVIIDHNNGYWTVYAHLNETYVRQGQIVEKGHVVGGMGTTGLSTGVHLHFELRVGGNTKYYAVNPRTYIS